MDAWLSTLAFAVLIGAQFLAAIVLISKRTTIYADPRARVEAESVRPSPTAQPDQIDREIVETERPATAA